MSKKRERIAAVGGSSLLVIFAVLTLVLLALLSFSTVQADGRLSDAHATHVKQYYQADAQAELILAQLRNGILPEQVQKEGNQYSYQCPISDTQALQVVVAFAGQEYQIKEWRAVSTVDWTIEENKAVWNGEDEK